MKTKFLLISAIDPYSEVQARFPQLGLAYLAASLRKTFPGQFEFRIINRDIEKILDSCRPDVVGISAVTQNYNYAKQYAAAAKSRGIPVIMGGIHISSLPQTLTADMDIAVIGEGEETILSLMEHFLTFGSFPQYVPGTAWADETGWVHVNTPRRPIEPLDRLPMPARDLLQIRTQSNLFSSRGCPYSCRFCFSSRYWRKTRFFHAEYVADELRQMAGMGVKRVNFYDDLMIADVRRLEILHEIIRRDPVLSKLTFWLNARANTVTEHTAELMAGMGVVSVGMGLESGNERTLRYLKGDSVTVADNYNAVQILHKHGIAATASFIIGSPDETEAEIMDTYRFIEESGLDFVDTFPLVPFPNTPVWDDAKKRSLVNETGMDWSRFGVYYGPKTILMSKTISRERMAEIHRKFWWQRLRIAAKRAWFHPFFGEMVKAGMKKGWNLCRS